MTVVHLRVWVLATALLFASVFRGIVLQEAQASLVASTTASPPLASGALAAPGATNCAWTSATQLTFSWSLSPHGPESSTDVWRADSISGAQTAVTNVPVATTSVVVTPPTPVTTVRWLTANTKRSVGTWTSAQPTPVATNTCRGAIVAFAGSGTAGYAGDGAVATAAQLNAPRGIAVDTSRNVYVADTTNNRIRRVDATTGIVTTAVGSGGVSPFSACSFTGTAATVKLNLPEDVAVDASGNLYIADTGQGCIRKVDTAGNVTPVAGGGATTTCNATMLATAVSLLTPRGVDVDSTGAVIVADSGRSCIRKVSGGNATFLAGGGATTTCNTTVTASSVSLSNPTSVAVNAANEVFVADTGRNCIRKVSGGNASFVAGGGATTTCSATGLATSVSLLSPEGVAVDSAGRVLVSDTGRDCLRMVTAGNVSRVAFTGTASATGDNGPAVAATVATPARVAVGPDGSLYVADRATTAASSVVRKIVGSWPP